MKTPELGKADRKRRFAMGKCGRCSMPRMPHATYCRACAMRASKRYYQKLVKVC